MGWEGGGGGGGGGWELDHQSSAWKHTALTIPPQPLHQIFFFFFFRLFLNFFRLFFFF